MIASITKYFNTFCVTKNETFLSYLLMSVIKQMSNCYLYISMKWLELGGLLNVVSFDDV